MIMFIIANRFADLLQHLPVPLVSKFPEHNIYNWDDLSNNLQKKYNKNWQPSWVHLLLQHHGQLHSPEGLL